MPRLLSNIQSCCPLWGFFIAIVFASCEKPADYEDVPRIEFNSVSAEIVQGLLNEEFRVTIGVNFEDGDGDLGITEEAAKSSKYDGYRDSVFVPKQIVPCAPDAPPSCVADTIAEYYDLTYNNLRVSMFKQDRLGNVKPIVLNSYLHQRFDPFLEDEIVSPVDGVFKFRISHTASILLNSDLDQCDLVFYEVALRDRSNNQSNTIATAPVYLFGDSLSCP